MAIVAEIYPSLAIVGGCYRRIVVNMFYPKQPNRFVDIFDLEPNSTILTSPMTMKNQHPNISRNHPRLILQRLAVLLLMLASAAIAQAGVFVKTNNVDALNLATAWTNNVVPSSSDIAQWDATVPSANNTTNALGADTAWDGIKIVDPAGPVQIDAGNTLTLGNTGIDMSLAAADLTLACGVATPANSVQTWSVASGRTLSVPGTLSQSSLSALYFDFAPGATVNIGSGTVSNILYNTTFNGYDVGGLDASLNVVDAGSVIPGGYEANNPAFLGTPVTSFVDVVNGNTGTGDDVSFTASAAWYPRIIRFNTPQPNRDYWVWNVAGRRMYINSPGATVLITTNVGAQDVYFEGTYLTFRWFGGPLFLAQENPAGTMYMNGVAASGSSSSANTMTKYGAGRVIWNDSLPNQGANSIVEGEFVLNGNASKAVTVCDGALFRCSGTLQDTLTVKTGGTVSPGNENAVGALTANGNVTLDAGSTIQFFSTAVPVTNTAPLMTLAGNLTLSGAVNISIMAGTAAVGQYPLIQWTNAVAEADFTNLVLTTMPLRTYGYLSNNVANNSIDLVVTNVTEPIHWAVGNGTWDIGGTPNWKDTLGNSTTYQEVGGLSDSVLFDDSASGSSPITVTLNANPSPASVMVDGSKDYTISGSGSINGGCSFTKTSSGTLTLGTANTFGGGINLNGGTTVFSSLDNLGAGDISFGGGGLQYSGNTDDLSSRTVTLNAGGGTINIGANDVTFANPVGNGGAGGLTKLGSGALTMNGTNDYNGDTVISQGTLALVNNAALPNSPNIVVGSGALFDVNNNGGYSLSQTAGQTLSGDGYVNGSYFAVTNGTALSPGTDSTVGTLTFTNPSGCYLDIYGTLTLNVTTTGSDLIVADLVSLEPGMVLTIPSPALTNGDYKLLQANQGFIGSSSTAGISFILGQPGKSGDLVVVDDGGGTNSLHLIVADAASDDITWSGSNFLWDQSGNTDWYKTGTSTPWAFTNGDIVRFDERGVAYSSLNVGGVVKPSLVVVSNPVTSYSLNPDSAGKISGTGGLLKLGAADLTINTLDDNTGPTTIEGGSVYVVGSIGAGPVTNDSQLILQHGTAQTIASISGTGALTQNGATTTVAGRADYTGPTTIQSGTLTIGSGGPEGVMSTSAITNNGTLMLNSSTDWSYNIPDTGTGNLRQIGTNTIIMSGPNTRTGETRADSGKIVLANVNQLQGPARLEGTGMLDMNGHDQLLPGLTSGSYTAKIVNDGGTGVNTLAISNDASATVQAQVVDNDDSGAGTIAVLKTGAGELYWRGTPNTYSGGTEIRNGRIRVNSSDLFGTGPVNLAGGGLNLTSGSPTNTINLLAPVGATTNFLRNGGNITFVAPVVGANNLLVDFPPGSSSSLTFRQSGGAGQWAGMTGTVYLRSEDPSKGGNFSAYADIDMSGATVDMNDSQATIASSGARSIQLGALLGNTNSAALNAGSGSTFYVGAKNLSTTFAGRLGGTSTANNLVKVGSGTLTLTGTNVFTGGLTVSNGTLAVALDGAPSLMSAIRVAVGATLDVTGLAGSTLNLGDNTNNIAQTLAGNGTINGNVLIDTNATVSPGASIGTLTINNALTIDGAATMELNRTNSQTADLINAASFSGTGTVNITNIGPDLITGDTFQLFNHAVPGVTVNLPVSNALNTVEYVWNNQVDVDGSIELVSGASPINTNAPVMGVTYSGGVLTLSWPTNAGWTLQRQTNSLFTGLSTNWATYVDGSIGITSTNIPVDPTKPAVFYRLMLP